MKLGDVAATCMMLGATEEAETCLKMVLADRPDDEQALLNYATLCRRTNRLEKAIGLVSKYLDSHKEIRPEAWLTFGLLCEDFGKFKEAAGAYGKALAKEPGDQNTAIGYGSSLMRLQRFDEGFPHWDYGRFMSAWQPIPGIGIWNGADPKGKRILVIREGGYGDGIMFARWIPKLIEAGAEIGFFVWDSLHPLLANLGCRLIGEKDPIDTTEWDFCCSLLSLPRLCGMHALEDIPEPVTISGVEPRKPEGIQTVGLCWAAEENGESRKHRSMTLADIEPLKSTEKIFCSLCPGIAAPDWVRPHTAGKQGWATDARVIAGLDLVITVDTAVAHLAGSMGVPTWLLLPMYSSWQWFTPETFAYTTPWYKSVRVFRQKDAIKWDGVVEEVEVALLNA
jgi:hypothetical protein